MITEAKEIFSDLEFFNNLFKDIKYKPTRAFFEERLFKNEEVNIENFDKDKCAFKSFDHYDETYYVFFFELKNKKINNYYPTSIRIEYNSSQGKYQIESVTYTNDDSKVTIGYAFDDDLISKFKENKKDILFSYTNKLETKFLSFLIKDDTVIVENKENIESKLENYLNNLSNPIEMVSTIKRMLLLKNASLEQQDLDILKYDFKVENSIFSGYLNKASDIFRKNYISNNKNHKNNAI